MKAPLNLFIPLLSLIFGLNAQKVHAFAPPAARHAYSFILPPNSLFTGSINGKQLTNKPITVPINSAQQQKSPRKLQLTATVSPVVVGSAVVHVIAGSIATPFVIDAVKTWYRRIPLPSWTPPDNVFAPVWTVLYTCLGIAAARVATVAKGGWKSTPLLLWALHMALNLSWAPAFFGMAKLRAGLIINCLMLVTMPFILKMYAAVDPLSTVLLLPYLGWLLFATVLNQAICKLNPMDGTGYSNAILEADIAKLQKHAAKKAGL